MTGRFILMFCVWLSCLWISSQSFAAEESAAARKADGTWEQRGWDAWRSELERQCPSHRVYWVEDGGYDELLAAFERTLPVKTRRELTKLQDWDHNCQNVEGFTCEMAVSVGSYAKLGLIKQFATYGCRHRRCEDIAMCDEIGSGH